jgi:GAF domain-containing protein
MEPLPEVTAALGDLQGLLAEPGDLAAKLDAVANVAVGLVPSCMGVSLTVIIEGDPFTITSTDPEAGVVDAAQYLDGGPCVDAAEHAGQVTVEDVLDEDQWQVFQLASAAAGIRASLSVPLRDDGERVIGALNLYATEPDAFHDRADIIAGIFGAPVEELVANADLSFRTRDWARELPARVAAKVDLETAVGVLMAQRGWDATTSRERLRDAAAHAQVPVGRLASVVCKLAEP